MTAKSYGATTIADANKTLTDHGRMRSSVLLSLLPVAKLVLFRAKSSANQLSKHYRHRQGRSLLSRSKGHRHTPYVPGYCGSSISSVVLENVVDLRAYSTSIKLQI
jgi:hypothetical protein